jgi:predicted HicB family RNase H-like nuclease
MSEPRATLLIRVSASLKGKLTEMAKREKRSLSKQVELLLERYVAVLDKESSSESRHKARSKSG